MGTASDFIGRVRERDAAAERRRTMTKRISVLVTRDGEKAEELIFRRPPTLAELVARVGSGAYVLGIDIAEETPLAAE